MAWNNIKEWFANMIPSSGDFNRIEGNTLDNHERLDGHDSELSNHDGRISSNDSDISSINSTLSSHNSRISSNDNDIANHNSRISSNESRLDNIKWVSGRYIGNGANGRFIPVGFTPDIVLLNRGSDGYGDTSANSATVIFNTVHDTVDCTITSKGFIVSGSGVNHNEWYYQWIAIKL